MPPELLNGDLAVARRPCPRHPGPLMPPEPLNGDLGVARFPARVIGER
jgi:hypothetical protein